MATDFEEDPSLDADNSDYDSDSDSTDSGRGERSQYHELADSFGEKRVWGFLVFRTYTSLPGSVSSLNPASNVVDVGTAIEEKEPDMNLEHEADKPASASASAIDSGKTEGTEEIEMKPSLLSETKLTTTEHIRTEHDRSTPPPPAVGSSNHDSPAHEGKPPPTKRENLTVTGRIATGEDDGVSSAEETGDERMAPEHLQRLDADNIDDDDPQWQRIYREIREQLLKGLDEAPDRPRRIIVDRLRLPVTHLPSATIADVRDRLVEHQAGQQKRRENGDSYFIPVPTERNFGIMVDEKVAASLLVGGTRAFVRVVDGSYEPTFGPDGQEEGEVEIITSLSRDGWIFYFGWMFATAHMLYELWESVVANGMVRMYQGPHHVWDGMGGSFKIDEAV